MKKRKGRAIDGIVVLDKPIGESSNRSLQRVKRLFNAQKAGHTGNLDPLATGVLPICLGEATKFSQYLLDADKSYQADIVLGIQTDTGDADGTVIEVSDASFINQALLETAIKQFVGTIEQVPPMYSALKFQGQPLYKLARQGIEVERKSRSITIYSIELLAFVAGNPASARILVHCSKGTYIRTLAEDIAKVLGVGAHLSALRRIKSGDFDLSQSVSFAELEKIALEQDVQVLDSLLIASEYAVKYLPSVEVSSKEGYHLRLGQKVPIKEVTFDGLARVKQEDGLFIGLAEVVDKHVLAPKRMIVTETEN